MGDPHRWVNSRSRTADGRRRSGREHHRGAACLRRSGRIACRRSRTSPRCGRRAVPPSGTACARRAGGDWRARWHVRTRYARIGWRACRRLDSEAEERIADSLERALGGPPSDMIVRRLVIVGDPARALANVGWRGDDLLVVGTDGGSPIASSHEGVGQQVLHPTRPLPGTRRPTGRVCAHGSPTDAAATVAATPPPLGGVRRSDRP